MTAPLVQFVLDAIDTNTSQALADIPLERIDRDNSDLLDGAPVHQMGAELEEMNYVGAALESLNGDPIGADYDLAVDPVVSVRLVGAHVAEFGAIDPQIGTPQARSPGYPTTTWYDLTQAVRRAVLDARTFPAVGASNFAFKDLFIENYTDTASEYADYYQLDFDVRFGGFEVLP